jgi:CRISPR-associated protein Csx14
VKKKEILMATLGVNPQIITISLDLLAKQGCQIDEVVSIYTDNEFVKEALAQLDTELQRLGGLLHRPVLISSETGSIRDFLTEADATALLQTLYREVKAYKQAGWRIHFMIAGGRRVMSAYALVVAQLLFDETDRVWHLFSDFWQENRDRKMHVEPGDYAILVPVPVLRWTPMTSIVTDLVLTNDPWQVINRQQELQQREHDQRLRAFLRGLTEAQRQVARLLAAGLDNKAIAVRRGASVNTVTKQVSAIYEEWRTFLGLPEGASVRDQVVAELAQYFARQQ